MLLLAGFNISRSPGSKWLGTTPIFVHAATVAYVCWNATVAGLVYIGGAILPLMIRIVISHTDSVFLTKQTYGMHVESFFPCRSSWVVYHHFSWSSGSRLKQKGPPVISPYKLVEMGIFPNLQMHFTKGPFLDTREYLQIGLFNLEKGTDFIHLPNYCCLLPHKRQITLRTQTPIDFS